MMDLGVACDFCCIL